MGGGETPQENHGAVARGYAEGIGEAGRVRQTLSRAWIYGFARTGKIGGMRVPLNRERK